MIDAFAPVPAGIRPEWYFLAMFHTLKIIPSHLFGFEGEMLGVLGFSLAAALLGSALGFLFYNFSCTASRRSGHHCHWSRSGNTKFIFKFLDELRKLENGHVRNEINYVFL